MKGNSMKMRKNTAPKKIVEIDHVCAVPMHIYTHGRQHAQERACLANEMQTKL